MSSASYKICTRCIMDTSDPAITFDSNGHCNHCIRVMNELRPQWFPNDEGARRIDSLVQQMKSERRGDYDCIIGLSGGVDSSYLAYIAKTRLGLNPLAVHVDGGWNSEEAVSNIEKITTKLKIDLYSIVVDWDEMQDIQLSFLKASVPNQDIPQDHAFFAGLYDYAVRYNIKHVLSGSNYATESILPPSWGYDAMDSIHLKAIHKQFGKNKIRTFPILTLFKQHVYHPHIKGMTVVKPLNYMPYSKGMAMEVLERELGWRYYGGKHCESRFTKFFQSYYLPVKFGYDKRRAHLSSMIMNGETTREQALLQMETPPFDKQTIELDMEFVAKKLGISPDELKKLIQLENRAHLDYKTNRQLVNRIKHFKSILKSIVAK